MFCLKDCTDLGTFLRNLEKYLKDMTKNLFLIAVSLSKRDSCHLDFIENTSCRIATPTTSENNVSFSYF